LGLLRLLNKEQQIILLVKNILRNHSDIPKTLKNKMVSDNPLPYSTASLILNLSIVWR
jgi:hypothetical protein